MMKNKPVGGRGLKAPYQTKTIRVPLPVFKTIEKIVNHYRTKGEVMDFSNSSLTAEQALEKARLIYKSREGRTKSAKASMEKLLEIIYEDKFTI